jgi:hypothetical protein
MVFYTGIIISGLSEKTGKFLKYRLIIVDLIKSIIEIKMPTDYLYFPGQNMVSIHKAAMTLCLIVFPAVLSSCAGLQTKSQEERLLLRAEEFWAARVAGDLITCYKFEEVSKTGKQPASTYVRKHGGLVYKSAEVTRTDINGEDATVKVKLSYVIPALGSRNVFKTEAVDRWKSIDGEWYHYQRDSLHIGSGRKE